MYTRSHLEIRKTLKNQEKKCIMLYVTEHRTEVNLMSANNLPESKKKLGDLIKAVRKRNGLSQRALAKKIKIPNSNLKYIEDGVNAPSPTVYANIIENLELSEQDQEKLDLLYSLIRGTPPPDICNFVAENNGLYKAIRGAKRKLNSDEIEKISEIILKD